MHIITSNICVIDLKLLSCSGFGQTGPYASRGGFDLIAQAMSGLMSVTGEGGGRPPVKVGSPCTDIMCGTLGALGISGALRAREITGEGQLLDTSLYEAGIMLTYWQTAIYLGSGEIPEAMGSAHPLMAPCTNSHLLKFGCDLVILLCFVCHLRVCHSHTLS